MEWLGGLDWGNLSGWAACLLVVGIVFWAFVTDKIHPASTTRLFKEAWQLERDNRRELEEGKYDALLEAVRTAVAAVRGVQQGIAAELEDEDVPRGASVGPTRRRRSE